jgi:hypothetical protein
MGYYTTITYHTEHGLAPAYSNAHNASMTVWVATELTYGSKSFQRWHTCPKCGLDYPEGKLVRYRGGWYCEDDVRDFYDEGTTKVRVM